MDIICCEEKYEVNDEYGLCRFPVVSDGSDFFFMWERELGLVFGMVQDLCPPAMKLTNQPSGKLKFDEKRNAKMLLIENNKLFSFLPLNFIKRFRECIQVYYPPPLIVAILSYLGGSPAL
ncbi:hypothetical protein CEXT_719251 [Caerostris extrusa]|uniref:Uncharacterized protein n=1 Tax=Caerostris extrusa TaxID=172846 RepID=A0AAV4T6J0_CAEEX|nr:hypothetical protein CEXT_719251 [Caerostris extrusa]